MDVDSQQTQEAWRGIFFISAAIYAFGTIFYAMFGSGELQPWGMQVFEIEENGTTQQEPKTNIIMDDAGTSDC